MSEKPVSVVDTNVLLNLATPVVDTRSKGPSGADPLKALFVSSDVHTPASVVGELGATTGSDDLLSAAAELVLNASHQLTVHDVDSQLAEPLEYGLDQGESEAIWLANDLAADLFITDEFNSTNYLFVTLALEDRNTLFTTAHILCALARREILATEYVDSVLTYYVETKAWDEQYIDQLRRRYLHN
jgi:hypothetical protein